MLTAVLSDLVRLMLETPYVLCFVESGISVGLFEEGDWHLAGFDELIFLRRPPRMA
jgi:hypothetical protein